MPAGVVHTICVLDTIKSVALLVPIVTAVTADKFVPIMVTVVPPSIEPEVGIIDDNTGVDIIINYYIYILIKLKYFNL